MTNPVISYPGLHKSKLHDNLRLNEQCYFDKTMDYSVKTLVMLLNIKVLAERLKFLLEGSSYMMHQTNTIRIWEILGKPEKDSKYMLTSVVIATLLYK